MVMSRIRISGSKNYVIACSISCSQPCLPQSLASLTPIPPEIMLDRIIQRLILAHPQPSQHLPLLLRMHMNLQLAHLFPLPHNRLPHIRLDRMALQHRHGRRHGNCQIQTRKTASLDAADISNLEQILPVDERLDDPFQSGSVVIRDALVEQFEKGGLAEAETLLKDEDADDDPAERVEDGRAKVGAEDGKEGDA